MRRGQRALHHRCQFLQVERLGQIVEGAALGRGDRGQDGVLRAHDDDRKIRTHALDAGQQIEAVLVRQHDVGDDKIALAGRDPAPQPGRRAGGAHVITGAAEGLIEDGADRRIVIGHEDQP